MPRERSYHNSIVCVGVSAGYAGAAVNNFIDGYPFGGFVFAAVIGLLVSLVFFWRSLR